MNSINGQIYQHLLQTCENDGAGFLLLIDPDKCDLKTCSIRAEKASECGVDAILVGSSTVLAAHFSDSVRAVKNASSVPVIIFPGSHEQISPEADAIFFTSLISGRNPDYLIDEQVKGAPLVKQYNLESIPTGYMVVESGSLTAVQYVSDSSPIPRNNEDIAVAHALAAQYLGMRLVYLEAGSGAHNPVPLSMIQAVKSAVDIPVVVGGGLKNPRNCSERVAAGASFVVVGNSLERKFDPAFLSEMVAAVHIKESVQV